MNATRWDQKRKQFLHVLPAMLAGLVTPLMDQAATHQQVKEKYEDALRDLESQDRHIGGLKLEIEELNLLKSSSDVSNLARSAELYGISALYNMQLPADQDRRNSDTQSVIMNARAMFLCANSGASYLAAGVQRHYPRIVDRLKSGVPFRALLLDPLSEEKKLRNEINAAGEANDSKLPIGDIIRLCNQFGALDVRFVGHGMTCSLFIADDVLFFDPYHVGTQNGRIENRFLCLKIARTTVPSGKSYFDLFQNHIDALWRRGDPIEKWLPSNQERLSAQLGIGKLPALNR